MTKSKLFQTEELADDNFEFNKDGRKFSKEVENTGKKEKLLVISSFSFSHSVSKKTCTADTQEQGLFGRGLRENCTFLTMFSTEFFSKVI